MMADEITVEVDVKKTLSTLRMNRQRHSEIVAEARKGYVEAARKALDQKLRKLEAGAVVALHFSLEVPQDHTRVYDVAIQTLELHTEPTIELRGSQVRTLVMDDWGWSERFFTTNRAYSKLADEYADAKGI